MAIDISMSLVEALAWLLLLPALFSVYTEIKPINPSKEKTTIRTKLFIIKLLLLFSIFLYLPWQPASCDIRTALAMVMLWSAPAKLIMLAINRPIDHLQEWSFKTFLITVMLPVRLDPIKSNPNPNPNSNSNGASRGIFYNLRRSFWNLRGTFLKLLALVAILNSYQIWENNLAEPLRYLLYCLHFYLGLELYLSGVAAAVRYVFHVEASQPFGDPLGAVTLADFWGRRWNQFVGGVLRATVYDPVVGQMSGQVIRADIGVAKMVGGLATFLVSGLLHEVIFGYVTRTWPAGHMTAFFVFNGMGCVVQNALIYDKSRKKMRCPPWLAQASTLGFVYFTACLFFLKSLRDSRTDLESIGEYHKLQRTIMCALSINSHCH